MLSEGRFLVSGGGLGLKNVPTHENFAYGALCYENGFNMQMWMITNSEVKFSKWLEHSNRLLWALWICTCLGPFPHTPLCLS